MSLEKTPRARNEEAKEILWIYALRIDPAAANELKESKLIELLNFFRGIKNTIQSLQLQINDK